MQTVCLALYAFYCEADRTKAFGRLDEMIACSEHCGAVVFKAIALCRKAVLLDQTGRRAQAIDVFEDFLEIAVAQDMQGILLTTPDAVPLISFALRTGREESWSSRTMAFLNKCLLHLQSINFSKVALERFELSDREFDVLYQLNSGDSNKEIARALDMTENTVKFHLKNIFRKLDVENRGAAIELVQQSNIIT